MIASFGCVVAPKVMRSPWDNFFKDDIEASTSQIYKKGTYSDVGSLY